MTAQARDIQVTEADARSGAGTDLSMESSWPDTFKSGIEVWKYLKARGYTCSKRVVQKHITLGKLPYIQGKNARSRIFRRQAVDDYAKVHLADFAPTDLDARIREGDLSELQARKLRAAIEEHEARAALMRMKKDRELGKLLLRSEFESLLAARWVVLRAGFRAMVDLNLDAWERLLRDDPVQGRQVMREAILSEFLVLLNEFARAPEFEVQARQEGAD